MKSPNLCPWKNCQACTDGQKEKTSGKKYNVLFIAVDDMNDWISLYDGPIDTPNLQKLESKGIFFVHAYCSSPACNPSRITIMTGLNPSGTGVYGNNTDWRKALPDVVMNFYLCLRHTPWPPISQSEINLGLTLQDEYGEFRLCPIAPYTGSIHNLMMIICRKCLKLKRLSPELT